MVLNTVKQRVFTYLHVLTTIVFVIINQIRTYVMVAMY